MSNWDLFLGDFLRILPWDLSTCFTTIWVQISLELFPSASWRVANPSQVTTWKNQTGPSWLFRVYVGDEKEKEEVKPGIAQVVLPPVVIGHTYVCSWARREHLGPNPPVPHDPWPLCGKRLRGSPRTLAKAWNETARPGDPWALARDCIDCLKRQMYQLQQTARKMACGDFTEEELAEMEQANQECSLPSYAGILSLNHYKYYKGPYWTASISWKVGFFSWLNSKSSKWGGSTPPRHVAICKSIRDYYPPVN